jgi:hypothetical protein
MRSRTRVAARLAVAVVAVAAVGLPMASAGATGAPAATWASAGGVSAQTVGWAGTAPGRPAPDKVLQEAAKRFGVSEKRLALALAAVKQFIAKTSPCTPLDLLDPAVVRVFAKSLGVSVRTATAILEFLIAAWEKAAKDPKSGKPEAVPAAAITVLAKALGVSQAKAKAALERLFTMPSWSVTDPGFVAVARSLKVTPKQLQAALVAVKKALAKGEPKPGKPRPGEPKPGEPKPGEPKPCEPKPGAPKPPAPADV